MGEAIAMVKKHFGPNAVILHTRTCDTKRRLPGGAKQRVEITASQGEPPTPETKSSRIRQSEKPQTRAPVAARRTPTTDSKLTDRLITLQSSVDQLLHDRWSADDPSVPSHLKKTFQHLVESQVSTDIAAKLTRKIQRELTPAQLTNPESVRAKLTEFISTMLPVAETPRLTRSKTPHIIALVGATGVGKTTTIAKLTANHSLRHHKTVGLITTDTLRVGAADQLQTYADIIHVNLHVVSTTDQMQTALDQTRHCDIVFIDTPGCSPADADRIEDLKSLLEAAKPGETHLVLSAESNQGVIEQHTRRFEQLGFNRIIFTKLDEAIGFGVILNSLKTAHARLSFTTNGQRVPDDISPCNSEVLAHAIVSGLQIGTICA